ncbi:unnamed protein product [Colias eurytheme]|nr:unnamed protein product [Colias eurytheme]
MDKVQALYAESLIHTVLRKGILKQLTETTDICDKECNKTVVYHAAYISRPSSSSTPSVQENSAIIISQPQDIQNTENTESILREYYNNYDDNF